MSTDLHAALVAKAEEIDRQRMAAKESLKRLMEESAENPILKGAISGDRYFSPGTTTAAVKALYAAISEICGTKTHQLEIGHDFRSQVEAPYHRRDEPNLIRGALLNALAKYPAETLHENAQKQLRGKVMRTLWVRPGPNGPRLEKSGWVIRMSGGHSTYAAEPRANSALEQSLREGIPQLLELICQTPEELEREMSEYDTALRAWLGSGAPAPRRILEDYSRIRFRVFKEKAEIVLSIQDAETLQIELAEQMAEQRAA